MSRDDQTLFKRMYAGVFLQLLSRPERHLIDEVRKVKAHQSLNEDGLSQGEYALRLGNHSADLGAKEALAFHPRDEEVLDETDLSVKFARAACKLAAKLLPAFSALRASKDVQYNPVRVVPAPPPEKERHKWFQFDSFWRCDVCLQIRKPRDGKKPLPGRCSGLMTCDAERLSRFEHRCVMFSCSDGAQLVVCTRCKCYTSHGSLRGLRYPRNPPPGKFGVWAWQQICKGRHPKRSKLVVCGISAVQSEALESPAVVEPSASSLGERAPSCIGDLCAVRASLRREDKEAAFQAKIDRLVAAAGGRTLGGAHLSHDSDYD